MKTLGQTVSDKARKRIAIVAMLIIELKFHYQFIFLFFFCGRAFASSQMKIEYLVLVHDTCVIVLKICKI